MALSKNTVTIEEFIESGKGSSIDYFDLSLIDQMDNGTWVSVLNVANDYISELREACVNVRLSIDQQVKYFYKPKLLCYDVYGNPELYYIILLINDIIDVKEFTKEKIKMLRKHDMSKLIGLIYNAERKSIDTYNNKK